MLTIKILYEALWEMILHVHSTDLLSNFLNRFVHFVKPRMGMLQRNAKCLKPFVLKDNPCKEEEAITDEYGRNKSFPAAKIYGKKSEFTAHL